MRDLGDHKAEYTEQTRQGLAPRRFVDDVSIDVKIDLSEQRPTVLNWLPCKDCRNDSIQQYYSDLGNFAQQVGDGAGAVVAHKSRRRCSLVLNH